MLRTLKLRGVCALLVLGLAVSTVGLAQEAAKVGPSQPAAQAVSAVPGPEAPLGAPAVSSQEAPTLPIFQPAPQRVLNCGQIACNVNTNCTRLCGDIATCVSFGGPTGRCSFS